MKAILLSFFLFGISVGIRAQNPQDRITDALRTGSGGGPFGAPIRALAINPRNHLELYVGTGRGHVFKSIDGGERWMPASSGVADNRAVYSLAVDPLDGNVVYAATDGAGVYKSTNGALSWSRVDSGFKSQQVYSIVIDPSEHETVYASTYGGWIYKSTDGGRNWQGFTLGVRFGTFVSPLAIDPQNPSTIYAATGGSGVESVPYGVFKSTDRGETWQAINNGLQREWIFSLAVDFTNPNNLYVGIGLRKGLYRSADAGQTWFPADPGPNLYPSTIYAIVTDPSSPKRVYVGYGDILSGAGGILLSDDQGATWRKPISGFPSTSVRALASDPTQPSIIYAGTEMGIFKSIDGGENWRPASDGLAEMRINAIAISSNPTTLFVGTQGGGTFRSTDGGNTWHSSSQGLSVPNVCALTLDPSDSTTLYAGLDGAPFHQPNVFRSRDRGETWVGLESGTASMDVCSLIFHPHPSGSDAMFAGSSLQGLFKTADGGKTWVRISGTSGLPAGGVYSLIGIHTNPDTIYVRTGGGIFESTNGGDVWVPVVTGLERIFLGDRPPDRGGLAPSQSSRPLAIDPQDSSHFYAASSNDHGMMLELFETVDEGKSWTAINSSLANLRIRALAVDPSNSLVLYAGTDHGVFKSTDAGRNWQPVGTR